MPQVRRWRLGTIFTAVTAALLVLLGAVASLLAWQALSRAHEARLEARGRLLARLVAQSAAAELGRDASGGSVAPALRALREEGGIVFLAVLDENGATLALDAAPTFDPAVLPSLAASPRGRGGASDKEEWSAWDASATWSPPPPPQAYDALGQPVPRVAPAARTARAIAGLSRAEIHDELCEVMTALAIVTALAALVGSLVAFGFARALTRPISEMAETAAALARGDEPRTAPVRSSTREVAELADALDGVQQSLGLVAEHARRVAAGDLSRRVVGAGALGEAFNAMMESLSRLVGQIKTASVRIASASEEILAASRQAEKGSTEQASSIHQTTATMDELLSASKQIAASADAVVKIAERTLGAAKAGEDAVQQSITGMEEIGTNNRQTAERILELSERNQQIGNVVELIDEIADKSDLLALNAAIEGAKAGEAGRGFAVVATEMRALAENVVESTKEIKTLIGEIQKASNASVLATEGQMKATERGTRIALGTGERLREILQMVVQTTEAAKQISLATQQQRTGTEQVVQSMSEIARIARANVAGAGQTTVSTGELAGLAEQLERAVSQFRLGGEAPDR